VKLRQCFAQPHYFSPSEELFCHLEMETAYARTAKDCACQTQGPHLAPPLREQPLAQVMGYGTAAGCDCDTRPHAPAQPGCSFYPAVVVQCFCSETDFFYSGQVLSQCSRGPHFHKAAGYHCSVSVRLGRETHHLNRRALQFPPWQLTKVPVWPFPSVQ